MSAEERSSGVSVGSRVPSWIRRQWASIVLVGTGWVVLVGAARLDQESDALAGVSIGAGVLLVVLGALHHRGLKAAWSGASGSFELPPEPPSPADTTERLAEAPELPITVPAPEADDYTRYLLAEDVLERFVLHPRPPLNDCRGQVWLFDEEAQDLFGILQPGHPGRVRFAIGEGAVGQCWQRQEYVIAEPGSVTAPEFVLSEDKVDRYSDLVASVAVPISNEADEMLGVLSMSSKDPATTLGDEESLVEMVYLAEVAARVLVDLFKWFNDGRFSHPTEDA